MMGGSFFLDAAIAWRDLIRRPFYSVATMVMLSLALAANATAFGIFYGYDIKPLPYSDSSRVMVVRQMIPKLGLFNPTTSADFYRGIVGSLPSVEAAGLWAYGGSVVTTIDNKPCQVDVAAATPSFFITLGVQPVIGKLPDRLSGEAGGPLEAMISYGFWKGAYNGRLDVLGQLIPVNGANYRIVGVLPQGYGFLNQTDILTSMAPPSTGIPATSVNNFMPVRLAQGVSLEAFDNQLATVLPRLEQQEPVEQGVNFQTVGVTLDAKPIRSVILDSAEIGSIPILLQGTALFLLVLAIANAANLALVRNGARLQDFALRRLLGAGRAELLRMFLMGQLPILIGSVAIGSFLGWLALRTLSSYSNVFEVPPLDIAAGWPIYIFVLVVAVISIVLVTLAPVWQISAQRLTGGLGQGTKSTMTKASRRAQTALGVLQVALATSLLIGSAMLSLSFYFLLMQPLGFHPEGRVIASVLLPSSQNNSAALEAAVTAVGNLSTTKSAGGVAFSSYPFSQEQATMPLSGTGASAQPQTAGMVPVTDGYFKAMGITIAYGADFDPAAFVGSGKDEVIITPDLASALFGRTDVVGQMVKIVNLNCQVVGVTNPVLWDSTPQKGVSGAVFVPARTIMSAFPFVNFGGATVIANMAGSGQAARTSVESAVENAVPGSVVISVDPYHQVIATYNGLRAVAAGLVSGFATLALILAAIGVYAVNAFIARARLPEFGMRAMLGASPSRLLRLALTDAAWLLVFGLGSGAVGGYLLVHAMSPLLFQTGSDAPLVFAVCLSAIAAIVLAAAWPPAARAANSSVKTLLDSP